MVVENAELRVQRDELLAALKPVMEQLDGPNGEIVASYEGDKVLVANLKSAIAKAVQS
jgi:GTP-sensing pleiotropic transcriptional regulator CodY